MADAVVGQGGIGLVPEREAEVRGVEERLLLDAGEDHRPPAEASADIARRERVAHRQAVVRVVITVEGDADLLQVVRAAHPPGRLAGRLHGRQEQRDQHADDGDDDQQLDQGESQPPPSPHGRSLSLERSTTGVFIVSWPLGPSPAIATSTNNTGANMAQGSNPYQARVLRNETT